MRLTGEKFTFPTNDWYLPLDRLKFTLLLNFFSFVFFLCCSVSLSSFVFV